jgi:COPII coat assembly protein SEC16
MLDDWQENLAIITANRTKGDDLVITHLGDCLWKEKNEVRILCDKYTCFNFMVESNAQFIYAGCICSLMLFSC